jgi:hypothetical protein
MSPLRRFGAFWYDFIVGDDWRVAVGVAAALVVTAVVAAGSLPTWWLLPSAVAAVLVASVWRARDRSS